jgi:hypothetical protein
MGCRKSCLLCGFDALVDFSADRRVALAMVGEHSRVDWVHDQAIRNFASHFYDRFCRPVFKVSTRCV